MTAVQNYVVVCDACDAVLREGLSKRAFEARVVSGARGWHHEIVKVRAGLAPSYDFCPDCWANGKAKAFVESVRVAMQREGRLVP